MPKLSVLTFAFATAVFGYAAAGQYVTAEARDVRVAGEIEASALEEQRAGSFHSMRQDVADTPSWSVEPAPLQCVPASTCCKICTKGKACGDTCISAKKVCRVGRGCACDASKVCE